MPPPDALSQALSDRYRIEGELGRGGFATVFRAHDLRHDRPVALKVLHQEIAATLGSERFKQEILLAARLQHPHVLSVYDSGEADHQLWFTMPFVEGESLRDRINRERQLPVDEAVRIASETAGGLDYAHRHGVIHRDIKPENILLSDGHALVADFGIARALGGNGLTQTGAFMGTPAYMSPEQISGSAVDARADVYALGCVLYEMLVGEAPFAGPTASVVLARAMSEPPRPIRATRPAVSAMLEATVARAMARVPADRYATAADFAGALAAASNSTAVETAVAAPVVRNRRPVRLPVFVRLLVGAAAIGGALVVWHHYSSVTVSARRLAVLPFENLGGAADEYFADGITDEVRGKLAVLPGLQVTARSSAVQYKKNAGKSPEQIGRELNVDYLLTGTVRWQTPQAGGRRVRVSPELVRVSDGTARWQQPFDTELSDVFQMQADIASRVAEALDVALGTATKQQLDARPTASVAAYDAFLRAEQVSQSVTLNDAVPLRTAIGDYERAVAIDPAFMQAWAQLSRAACSIASASPTDADIERCRGGAERAVQLAPNRPQARLAMGAYYRLVAKDFNKALEQYTLGLQAAPNHAELLAGSAVVERNLGRFEPALTHLQRASQLDPRSVLAASTLARTYHDLHRHAEAQAEYGRAIALAPANLSVVQGRAADYLSQGDLAGARGVIAEALKHVDVSAVVTRFATFQEMMWVLPDDLRARVVDLQPSNFDNDRGMWALKVGATYRLMGDAAQARRYGDIAAQAFGETARRFPQDAQQQELYGRALALAEHKDDAIRAGERSLALRETSLDAVSGPYVKYQVARICIQAGQYSRALDLLEPLLSKPGDLTPGWLRIDPIFAPLRGNPRFERLLKRGS